MSSLPNSYASTMHLPFNRSCLDGQLVLQSPSGDSGGPGYAVLLRGNQMLVVNDSDGIKLPFGEWSNNSYV